MTQRFDPSLIHALTAGGAAPSTPGGTTVTALVDEAVCRAVDYIAGGDRRSARVNVTLTTGGGIHDFAWILFDTYTPAGSRDEHYSARTNDMDLMCGAPPSFHVSSADPADVHEQAAAFLATKFEGKDITVKVFRDEAGVSEPTEIATTATGTFVEEVIPDSV